MRIHIIMHASFEGAGAIKNWAMNNGHTISYTHTYKGESLPDISELDFLVVMGGPQSPTQLDKYPYLRDEINFTRKAIDQNKLVIGVCLGAQIISESLGAKTEQSPNKEIGVYPITLTEEGLKDNIFKNFPASFDVMHWHNDMPGLPEGATLLAYSEGCPRQAIKYNDRVYGLQCHMEMTNELIKGMVEHCTSDLKPGKYIQNAEELLGQDMADINQMMMNILNHLAEKA